jgi:2,3-diketo-5-methylthio-1-phosphopentane phosphatase
VSNESSRLHSSDSVAERLARASSIAIFCDFDGTFSVQDVGSTLARRYLGDEREALWGRYETGELDAWGYNMELLDGWELPAGTLHDFLETIELDAGAAAMLDWCTKREIPFEILSDGFDYNLDRLQIIHGLAFDYVANHLHYEGDAWRISAGGPNPSCICGTGICKGAIIEETRARAPGTLCIHIGDGSVSDLCGGLAADLVFAKGSLASALRERGCEYEPFETLLDVIRRLEVLLQRAASGGR